MKSLRSVSIVLIALLATFVGGSEAWARPPRPRMASAVVESVDYAARILRMRRSDPSEPLMVTWDTRTRFIVDNRFVDTPRLRRGQQIEVSYRTPFFGSRYATKIVLLAK